MSVITAPVSDFRGPGALIGEIAVPEEVLDIDCSLQGRVDLPPSVHDATPNVTSFSLKDSLDPSAAESTTELISPEEIKTPCNKMDRAASISEIERNNEHKCNRKQKATTISAIESKKQRA